MRYDASSDSLDLWPSGMAHDVWSVYHARVKLADIVALVDAITPGDYSPTFSRANPVPVHMP
jgi:hypothetical protein